MYSQFDIFLGNFFYHVYLKQFLCGCVYQSLHLYLQILNRKYSPLQVNKKNYSLCSSIFMISFFKI